VLQCVLRVCCSVLQCVIVVIDEGELNWKARVCCSVLQCVLQCVAV